VSNAWFSKIRIHALKEAILHPIDEPITRCFPRDLRRKAFQPIQTVPRAAVEPVPRSDNSAAAFRGPHCAAGLSDAAEWGVRGGEVVAVRGFRLQGFGPLGVELIEAHEGFYWSWIWVGAGCLLVLVGVGWHFWEGLWKYY